MKKMISTEGEKEIKGQGTNISVAQFPKKAYISRKQQ